MFHASKSTEIHRFKTKHLTRESWVIAAIETLAQEGIGSVTILQLAEKLDITRGSFYYHFKHREDLLEAMLEYWYYEWTIKIKTDLDALAIEPTAKLLALIRLIRLNKAAYYDSAFRAWALHDPKARSMVKKTDDIRLSYIRKLFEGSGFKGIDAENRARLLLYYETCEPTMFTEQSNKLEEQLIKARHKLLTKA